MTRAAPRKSLSKIPSSPISTSPSCRQTGQASKGSGRQTRLPSATEPSGYANGYVTDLRRTLCLSLMVTSCATSPPDPMDHRRTHGETLKPGSIGSTRSLSTRMTVSWTRSKLWQPREGMLKHPRRCRGHTREQGLDLVLVRLLWTRCASSMHIIDGYRKGSVEDPIRRCVALRYRKTRGIERRQMGA